MPHPILLLLAFHGFPFRHGLGSQMELGGSVPAPHGSQPFVVRLKWTEAGQAPD